MSIKKNVMLSLVSAAFALAATTALSQTQTQSAQTAAADTAGVSSDTPVAGDANENGILETVIVSAQEEPAVQATPGGSASVNATTLQPESIANTADALAFVPGLFAQSVAGGEATRLSSRGSGEGNNGGFTWGSGIQVLLDGLPLSTPYGSPYESFEPNAYSNIEVYRGANAFEFGATQLGGAINFVEHTGYDSAPLFLRAEGGSDGYQREQISSGQVIGPFDYYLSLNHYQTSGFLDNSAAHSDRLISNVGFQVTPQVQTRFFVEFAEQRQQKINAETLAQLTTDPQLNPGLTGDRINPGTQTLLNLTTWTIDPSSSLQAGVEYNNTPIYDGPGTDTSIGDWFVSYWATSLRYQRKDTLFGSHESDTTAAFRSSTVIRNSGETDTNETTNIVEGSIRYAGGDNILLASNNFALTSKFWLLTGVAAEWLDRGNQILNPVAAGVDPDLDKHYRRVVPRIGLRYSVLPAVQLYGNVSGIVQAPQISGYAATSTAGAFTGYATTNGGVTFNSRELTVQTGTSYEIGTRGGTQRIRWDIDYYNEQLHHELLTSYVILPSPTVPAGVSFTANATPTVHEGVEATLDAVLWQWEGQSLSLQQAYTFGHFYFLDQTAEQHLIPGLPERSYQGEIDYQHSSGFYANANVNVQGRYPVDYANQAFAPSYVLLGAVIGYAGPKDKWRIFLEGANLTNRYYAAFTSTTGLATAASAVYTPGVGRSVIGGFTYSIQ